MAVDDREAGGDEISNALRHHRVANAQRGQQIGSGKAAPRIFYEEFQDFERPDRAEIADKRFKMSLIGHPFALSRFGPCLWEGCRPTPSSPPRNRKLPREGNYLPSCGNSVSMQHKKKAW